jgi:RHS repeat-associated protein
VFARFNMGDRFGPRVELPPDWLSGKRLLTAQNGEWRLRTEFLDIDGDGMNDLVRWNGDGTATYVASPGLPQASDLLRAVDNGRGKRVEFRYAPTSDPAVVQWTTLTQGGPHLPSVQWVVERTTVEGGFASPPVVTRYGYRDPRYLTPPAHEGLAERTTFAGFGEATSTVEREDGVAARRVRRAFAYDLSGSPRGVPVREWVYNDDAGVLRPHSFTRTRWLRTPLFSGEVSFTRRLDRVTRTCLPSASESACMAQRENVRTERETWRAVMAGEVTPLPPTRPAELYVHAATVQASGLDVREGDKRTATTYQVRYGQDGFLPDDYRVLVVRNRLMQAFIENDDVVFRVRGQTVHSLDAAGLPVRTDVFHEAATIATTRRAFDTAGNQVSETRPVQAAAGDNGKSRTFELDAHGLYTVGTIDELGHRVGTHYDVATGALLERSGPNAKTLSSGERVVERETWRTDGFGRVLEHAVSIDDAAAGYVTHVVERTAYFDGAEPNRVRTQRLRDFGGDIWLTEDSTIDGLGRVMSISVDAGAGKHAVTAYEYDPLGSVVAISVPDPRTDDSLVQYQYRHDGLSRLVEFRRPDGSGLSIAYAGLAKTSCEIAADGSGSAKKQVYDVFDRLVEVHELEGTTSVAVTRHSYDAADNLVTITDAEGDVTTLAHDWVGHRVAISRGSRTWQYVYDLNGALVEERKPHRPGSDPAAAATRYHRDALDRVRAIEFADREGPKTVRQTYDEGVNGLGRLAQVELPFGTVHYGYDARGLLALERRTISLPVRRLTIMQAVEREYNALGMPTRSRWDDGQQWRITYDVRGLVESVAVLQPTPQLWQQVASYERTLAGAPRRRGGSFGQLQDFAYDVLGRPVQDTVARAGGNIMASRSYTYTGSGDLAAVTGTSNGRPVDARFTYDGMHRLRTAEGPNGYRGSFSYSPAGNILTADVTWNDSPRTRKVRYEYGDLDRQAVACIFNVDDSVYAAFTYDEAGNVIERRTSDGTLTLDWDSRGTIRRVEGSGGAETYYYDHTGMRVLALGEREGVRFWFAESEAHYTLDGRQLRRYLHLSSGGATLARVTDGEAIELQYADALRNLMLSLDAGGEVEASFLYGPFGEVVHAVGEGDHRRQFNGKEHDGVSGLRYYGFRYYDPVSLRWTSADPLYRFMPEIGLSEPQRLNLYSFSLNNPLRYYDADGRDANDADDERVDPGSMTCELAEPGTCEIDENGNAESDESADEQTSRAEPDAAPEQADPPIANAVVAAVGAVLTHPKGAKAASYVAVSVAVQISTSQGATSAERTERALAAAKGPGIINKGASGLGVILGVHRAATGKDSADKVLGGLEATASAMSLSSNPKVAVAGAALSVGLAIGQLIDTGGHVSDALASYMHMQTEFYTNQDIPILMRMPY